MAQYIAKYINFPFLTMFIIHLHARQPETNAAIKPTISGNRPIPLDAISTPCDIPLTISSKASPNIGGITIKKENLANFSLLFPNNNPVAIVVPERDNPGRTAKA